MVRTVLRVAVLCAVALATVSGTSLTKDNFEELSSGKTVFVKFQAPWCSPLHSRPFDAMCCVQACRVALHGYDVLLSALALARESVPRKVGVPDQMRLPTRTTGVPACVLALPSRDATQTAVADESLLLHLQCAGEATANP